MPLVFVPEIATFFLHGERSILAGLAEGAAQHTLALVVPPGLRRRVRGVVLPRERVIECLARATSAELERAPGSFVAYALIGRFALDLIAREHVVPVRCDDDDEHGAVVRWGAALAHPRDVERLSALARSLPPATHAVPTGDGVEVWTPDASYARRSMQSSTRSCARARRRSSATTMRPTDGGGRRGGSRR